MQAEPGKTQMTFLKIIMIDSETRSLGTRTKNRIERGRGVGKDLGEGIKENLGSNDSTTLYFSVSLWCKIISFCRRLCYSDGFTG